MTIDITPRPVAVTLVHSAACHLCDDAQEALQRLSADHPLEVTVVSLDSPAGSELVARYRPAMNPLVVVDGEFFSSGRFPRKKMLRLLEARASRAATTAGR